MQIRVIRELKSCGYYESYQDWNRLISTSHIKDVVTTALRPLPYSCKWSYQLGYQNWVPRYQIRYQSQ